MPAPSYRFEPNETSIAYLHLDRRDRDGRALFLAMQMLYAVREATVILIGYLGSIIAYKETDHFGEWIRRAKSPGFKGNFCIHPNQVEILNRAFRLSIDEVGGAEALVSSK